MSAHRSARDREDEELHLSHSSSPFRLKNVSPIQSKYRDADGNDIPIYRTSCPDCSNHVKEMIRIHELWQLTKKDLRESRRAHENLLKEYKEEVDRTAKQHQRIVDGFHDEIEALRADLRVKTEQVQNLRAENAAVQHTSNDVNQQLSVIHERYAEQVSDNSQLTVRVRELEQALAQVRLERESVFDQTVHALREEQRSAAMTLDKQNSDLNFQQREIARLQEIVDNQNAELARWKQVERKQNELFEAASDERARLTATVRQQSSLLDDGAAEINKLRSKLQEQTRRVEREEDEKSLLLKQVRDLKAMEEQMEEQALGEFRRSRRHIENRLEKLQSECAQVANMMSPGKTAHAGANDRLPDWLPPAVATLVKSFRASLLEGGGNVGEEMSSFLIALNRIWRERLEEKLRQVRLHHAADIRELKRRLAQRIPYEQVVQKARILRLQKDLDTTRAVHLKAKGDQSKGLLDLSLSTVENLSRQILEYERENSLLKNQITLLMNDKNSASGRSHDSASFVAQATVSAVNSLGDKLWGNANSYMEKTQKLAGAGAGDVAAKVNAEAELFLDALEVDVRACKAAVKRALAETENEDWGGAGHDQ